MSDKTFNTDPVSVQVSGRKLLLSFIVPIIILEGQRISTADLVERENDILSQIEEEKKKKKSDPELIERLQNQLKLPDLVGRYERNGFKSESFRLLNEAEAVELSVRVSKADLIRENEELKARLAELEAEAGENKKEE